MVNRIQPVIIDKENSKDISKVLASGEIARRKYERVFFDVIRKLQEEMYVLENYWDERKQI